MSLAASLYVARRRTRDSQSWSDTEVVTVRLTINDPEHLMTLPRKAEGAGFSHGHYLHVKRVGDEVVILCRNTERFAQFDVLVGTALHRLRKELLADMEPGAEQTVEVAIPDHTVDHMVVTLLLFSDEIGELSKIGFR